MERQIESWNLTDCNNTTGSNKKPYIDMATVEKVLSDQDYSIVSIKMQIFELENQLQEREETFLKMLERNKEVDKISSVLNHEIALSKV